MFIGLICFWLVICFWLIYRTSKLVADSVVTKTPTQTDDKLLSLIKWSVLGGVFMAGIYSILLHVNIDTYTTIDVDKLFTSIFLSLIGIFLYSFISIIFIEIHERKYSKQGQSVHVAVPFLNNIFKFVISTGVILAILRLYEVDITPALASAGVVGVAVAFAAKDLVANLFGGLSVFFDKPYTIGDYVIVDQIHRGEVQEIGMRSTKIRTRDGVLITVPNSVMVTNVVVNETGFDTHLRIRIPLQVAYESKLDKIESLLLQAASDHDEIMKDPGPLVRYRGYSESGVSLELLIVISRPSEKGRITHELIKIIHTYFAKEKVTLPYPHRHVLMEKI